MVVSTESFGLSKFVEIWYGDSLELELVTGSIYRNTAVKRVFNFCPRTKRRRGKYERTFAYTVQAKDIDMIFERFLPLKLYNQLK
jgi:hypothetical protein